MTTVKDPPMDDLQVHALPPATPPPDPFGEGRPPKRRSRAPIAVAVGLAVLAGAAVLAFGNGDDGTVADTPAMDGPSTSMPMMRDGAASVDKGGPAVGATARDAARPSIVRVGVELGDMYVKPSVRSVSAGKVRFVARNVGKAEHELIVRRMTGHMSAPVEHDGLAMTEHMASMQTGGFTVRLKPGKYELFCNVPGHYAAGQRTTFKVTS